MSDWCPENDRAWQAEQAERHGENTLKARIRELEAEIEDAKATAHERGYYQGKAAGDAFGAAMREYVTRLEAENKALRDERDDAISTLNAWFDRRELAHSAIDAALEPVDRALRHIEGCLTFPVSTEINARGYDTRTPTPETVKYMVELVVEARAALAETEGE